MMAHLWPSVSTLRSRRHTARALTLRSSPFVRARRSTLIVTQALGKSLATEKEEGRERGGWAKQSFIEDETEHCFRAILTSTGPLYSARTVRVEALSCTKASRERSRTNFYQLHGRPPAAQKSALPALLRARALDP